MAPHLQSHPHLRLPAWHRFCSDLWTIPRAPIVLWCLHGRNLGSSHVERSRKRSPWSSWFYQWGIATRLRCRVHHRRRDQFIRRSGSQGRVEGFVLDCLWFIVRYRLLPGSTSRERALPASREGRSGKKNYENGKFLEGDKGDTQTGLALVYLCRFSDGRLEIYFYFSFSELHELFLGLTFLSHASQVGAQFTITNAPLWRSLIYIARICTPRFSRRRRALYLVV